jgi:uncharacterized RmlC-like cupin family protein
MNETMCRVIRSGEAYQGLQGVTYFTGLTGATAGSRAICMTLGVLPAGARAKTHLHRGIETAVYVIEGSTDMHFGERLEHCITAAAGEYMYVPADVPHCVINRSSEVCRAVVAHTAADDQQGIVLLPELDSLV